MRVDFLGEERTRLLKNYALISLVAITIDLIVFYILTKKYNFKDKNKVMEQIGSFLVVMFIGLITTQFLLLIFVEFVFLDEFLARTIVLPIVGIFHFWAHKNITFKKRGDSFYLNKYKDLILNSIGFLFLLIGTVAYYNAFVQNNFELVFWMCYLNLIILGVGVLSKNDKIIVAMLNIVSIPLIIWSFDFIVLLIGRTSPFGITGYFLTPGPIISKLVTMQHLITVPLAFYSLYLIKIRKIHTAGINTINIFFWCCKHSCYNKHKNHQTKTKYPSSAFPNLYQIQRVKREGYSDKMLHCDK